ncbi:MAG: hypothetical protein R2718_05715 [Solirubrobacterales bacterium]|nr:hypothetical protein [Solirubrobacterales bacterium]
MGILDDAIREHLELKRQHGAASSELDQLEQEVFGPAARPGDPEFETGEEPAPAAELEAVPEDAAEAPEAAFEDPTTVVPQASEPESVEQPIPEAPEGAIFDVEGSSELEDVDIDEAFKTPAERAREEHSHLDDTVDHPAPEVTSLSDELEAAAPTPAPDSAEMDVPHVSPSEEPEPGDPEIPGAAPGESLEFDELPGETVEARTDDESDDDLLEETPDFLKDAPDGEDLWFEQGEPKDFDFD